MPQFSTRQYRDWFKTIEPGKVDFVRAKVASGRLGKLVFDVASTCNMGCSYCFADRGRYGTKGSGAPKLLTVEMASAIITKVLENCEELGHIKFFGGEPLLAADAIAVVCRLTTEAAHQGRLNRVPGFNIITNGTVFSENIAGTLRQYSVRMTISIDGPKEIHDGQRRFANGRGTFDRIFENIKRFSDAGCRLGVLEAVFTPRHITSGLSMLSLYKTLVASFSGAFELIVVHPLDQPTINHLPNGEAKEQYIREMRNQTRELYRYLLSADAQTSERFRIRQMLKMLTSTIRDENLCGVGYDVITVKPDASVYSCYVFSEDTEFKYGNLLSDDFWKKYSDGSSVAVMNVGSRFKHDACAQCEIQKVCTHCLSGMASDLGLSQQLPDINCEFNIGQIEGFFEALQELRRADAFDNFCAAITRQ